MYLTKDYQKVGTSGNVCPTDTKKTWYYYTEFYAKAEPNEVTGEYKASFKLLLTCTLESTFYRFPTCFSLTVNNERVLLDTNKPWSEWTEKGSGGFPAATIFEFSKTIDCSDGQEHTVQLEALWQFTSWSTEWFTPNTGATATVSCNVTLPAIPRASKVSNLQSSNGCLDGVITYTLTPMSSVLRNRHIVKYNGNELFRQDIGSFSGAQTIYIDLSACLGTIYNNVTNTKDVEISVILETYNGTANIGTESTKNTFKIPENDMTRPVIESVLLSPEYSKNVSFDKAYVQGKTSIKKEVIAHARFGAVISEYIVTIDGNIYSGGWLSLSGKRKFLVTAKDSRGILSLPYEEEIEIFEYRVPLIRNHSAETEILCYRCDENGNQSDKGVNVYLKFGKEYSNIPGNVCRVNYRLRGEGESWGEYKPLDTNGTEYAEIVRGLFPNPSKAYHIQLQIIDGGNESTTKTFPIAAEWVDYQYNGNTKSWAFGESVPTSREKSFSLGLRAYFDKGVQPIAFIENNEKYGGEETTVEDEAMLLTTADMYNYTLFVVKAEGEAEYALGIRIGNIINFVGYASYIRLGETSFTLVQGDNYQNGVDFRINAIYGLI